MKEKIENETPDLFGKSSVKEKATVIGLHSVKNILGNEHQINAFSIEKINDFEKTYKVQIADTIDRFGIDLTDTQTKVMEGILRGFTETNYRGSDNTQSKNEILKEKYPFGNLPETYRYVKEIPCLRATQDQIFTWSGIKKNSIAERERAIEAIKVLSTKQYCFYYDRLALDENGNPQKDSAGGWKKEYVMAVDQLFTVKEVRESRDAPLEYYEITPSAIFLDQRESYFMLIPFNWREEVRKLVGSRKASSYTFRFLLFLRYQYEIKSRSANKEARPFTLKWHWKKIATALKIPASTYKRKKAQALKILEDACSVAKQLGYLIDYSRDGDTNCLVFNDEKYLPSSNGNSCFSKGSRDNPKEILAQVLSENIVNKPLKLNFSPDAIEIFDFFHTQRRVIDAGHPTPTGKVKQSQINALEQLLKTREKKDVEKLITWAFNRPFWCSRISTPAKLRDTFSDAWIEMHNQGLINDPISNVESNMTLAKSFINSPGYTKQTKVRVDVLSSYVEIGNGVHQPTCIHYTEKSFREKFENGLKKWGLL